MHKYLAEVMSLLGSTQGHMREGEEYQIKVASNVHGKVDRDNSFSSDILGANDQKYAL